MDLMLHFQMNDLDELAAAEEEMERQRQLKIERLRIRTASVYRLPDVEFRRLFRINKRTFHNIVEELEPYLRVAQHIDGINIETKVATTVRFLAQGAYQKGVGSETCVGLSQPSVSKTMRAVIDCINQVLCPKYVKFLISEAQRNSIAEWFQAEYKIPGVIGVVDGTQVGIFPPKSVNTEYPEHIYVNRKGFHSINAQIIVDHMYRIRGLNAKFPGSTHDSHIWRMSGIREHMKNTYGNNHQWLLGDSGYPLEPWLLTPFGNPNTEEKALFNNNFKKARCIVERGIGILKGRWRCLCKQRMLHYTPTISGKIINACAALHNICLDNDDPLPIDEIVQPPPALPGDHEVHFPAAHALVTVGNHNRDEVITYIMQHQNCMCTSSQIYYEYK